MTPTERTVEITPTVEALEEEGGEEEPLLGDHIAVEGVGNFALAGTALLCLHEEDGRRVLLILADSEDGLTEAMIRLVDADFSHCLSANDVTLCAVGEPVSESGVEPELDVELPPDHPPIE